MIKFHLPKSSSLSILFLCLICISSPFCLKAENDFIKPVSPLPVARGFHGAAVLGDFYYAIGGSAFVNGQQVPAVTTHVAKVFPDGQLSQFLTTSRIPQPRHYISNSTLVLNDTVYVFGGDEAIVNSKSANTIAWTRPSPNGMLEPWRESSPFPQRGGVSCAVTLATPGYLHVLGGTDQNDQVRNEVWSIKVNADGSLGEWESGPPMPVPLWFHSGAVAGGRVYIWGGLDYYVTKSVTRVCDGIYSAPILSSGRLGKWRKETETLPRGFYSAGTATAGPYIFCISPRYVKGEASSDLWWSYVTPSGMTTWKRVSTSLPNKLYRAVTTDYRRGIIYVSGGKPSRGENEVMDQFKIELSPQAKALAEQSWLATQTTNQYASIDYGTSRGNNLSFTSQQSVATGSIPGFFQLDTARNQAQKQGMPLVMYFHSEMAKPCQEQLALIQTEEFSSLLNQAIFSSINPQDYPQISQQYAVFRVPTWIFFNSNEEERGRVVGAQDLETLTNSITTLQ